MNDHRLVIKKSILFSGFEPRPSCIPSRCPIPARPEKILSAGLLMEIVHHFWMINDFLIFHLDQFSHLFSCIKSMRNSQMRSIRVALAVFLAKMRLGISNAVLASIFCLKNKRVIAQIIHDVSKALLNDFVCNNLGLGHIDRVSVLRDHQTSVSTKLMAERDDQVIIVMDGTYLFIQKSSDNKFQRRSFSMHKHRNLIKPMMITATVKAAIETILNTIQFSSSFLLASIFSVGWLHFECDRPFPS